MALTGAASRGPRESRPGSNSSMRAASGLILDAPKSARHGSTRVAPSAARVSSTPARSRGSAPRRAEEPAAVRFNPEDVVEVIEAFKSEEQVLKMGRIEGVNLSRGQRGKISSIDEDGNAYISFPDLRRTVFIGASQLRNFRIARVTKTSIPESPADLRAVQALLQKQEHNLAQILLELKTKGRKTSCWAWWVFPTEKEGMCDPDATRVTASTASRLLTNRSTAEQWRLVLEKICELVEDKGMRILPEIDHGRVHWFIKFWSELEGVPEWMRDACNRLGAFDWPPR